MKHQKDSTTVCVHWRAGRCTRIQCPFLHGELPSKKQNPNFKNTWRLQAPNPNPKQNLNFKNTWRKNTAAAATVEEKKVCKYWAKRNNGCRNGNNCRFLHSWTTGNCFELLKQLEGHKKVVTGVALPESGGSLLYSGSTDKTVRSWDCCTGQSAGVFDLDGETGCMLGEGPWLFVGLPNHVKAKNTQTGTLLSLNGPVFGQVHALVLSLDSSTLFAGTEDGKILAWKCGTNNEITTFDQPAVLKGHSGRVTSLIVGAGNRLYSGSMDKSIRVWDVETMQCLQVLTDHTSGVMSLLCYDQFLFSCSLDKTVKVWAASANEREKLEVTYTHQEEHAVLDLFGMNNAEAKPVLFCSCNDKTIRAYDLPSFSERAKIFSEERVRCIALGPHGLFFTGDESGHVRVWKWLTQN